MSVIKQLFQRIVFFSSKPKLNVLKTLYINFSTLKFKDAIKFPIYVYGKFQVVSGGGIINIHAPLKRGMIIIGKNTDHFIADRPTLFCLLQGTSITFEGPVIIGTGCSFRLSNKGSIVFGKHVFCGSGSKFLSEDKMIIGEFTQFAYNCQVLNTDFHYILDTKTNRVSRNTKAISIGAFNWIGNSSTIMKGTVTPQFTIVAACSLLNKNYREAEGNDGSFILAGTPAKPVALGYKRIMSSEMESDIRRYFNINDSNSFEWTDEMQDIR